MNSHQRAWAQARDQLAKAVSACGYPAELADLLAGQLGSPNSIDRMASYIRQAKPATLEMLIDEMLAIRAEAEAWRAKKESREAQAGYNAYLYRRKAEEDDGDR